MVCILAVCFVLHQTLTRRVESAKELLSVSGSYMTVSDYQFVTPYYQLVTPTWQPQLFHIHHLTWSSDWPSNHLHYKDEETMAQEVSNLPKFIQLLSGIFFHLYLKLVKCTQSRYTTPFVHRSRISGVIRFFWIVMGFEEKLSYQGTLRTVQSQSCHPILKINMGLWCLVS